MYRPLWLYPKRSDAGDSVSVARDLERAIHIGQRIYASPSATIVAGLLTVLCYGPLSAASNESKSLPGQGGRRHRGEASQDSTAPAQQKRQLARLHLQIHSPRQSRPQGRPRRGNRAPGRQGRSGAGPGRDRELRTCLAHQGVRRRYRKYLPRADVRAGEGGFSPSELDRGERGGDTA